MQTRSYLRELTAHRARYRSAMRILERVTEPARDVLDRAAEFATSSADVKHLYWMSEAVEWWSSIRIKRARGEDWPTWLWIGGFGTDHPVGNAEWSMERMNTPAWAYMGLRRYVEYRKGKPEYSRAVYGDHMYHGIKAG